MPKFTAIRDAIKDCNSPIMVFLSKGEVANQTTELKAFSNGDIDVVSNIESVFSPVDGSKLPLLEKSSHSVVGETFNQLDTLVTMKCNECNSLAGVDPDLAFEIASESMFCPSCGKETAYVYDASEIADDDEEDMDSTMSDDDDDDGDDSDDSDDSDDDDLEAVDDSDSDDEDSEDASVEEPVAMVTEPVVTEPVAADPVVTAPVEAPAVVTEPVNEAQVVAEPVAAVTETVVTEPLQEAASEEVVTTVTEPVAETVETVVAEPEVQEIQAASLVDDNAAVRLVTVASGNSEVAVFVGGVHVGTLFKNLASETAAPLFEDGNKLISAFKPAFNVNRSNQNSTELAAYGYKPVTFKVKISDLFTKNLEKEVASVQSKANDEVTTKLANMSSLVELAFVGINKGVFDAKHDLATELASLLSRNGVKNPETEVRRILAKHSHNYIKAGIEKAKELSTFSPEYVRGITETISKSEFSVKEPAVSEVASIISTSMFQPPRIKELANEDIVSSPKNDTKNKYLGVIRGIAR